MYGSYEIGYSRPMTPPALAVTAAAPSPADIDALIGRQRPGHALDREFYVEPAIFARDVERVLLQQWFLAGPACRAAGPGDYFTVELAGESVVVVRAEDGVVRAFYNVCRHRGARVCPGDGGNARKLVCPYHAWSYNLDGTLFKAQMMPDGFDPSGHGLRPVAAAELCGLIFVSLADEPLDLGPAVAGLAPHLDPLALGETQIVDRRTYRIEANWKLVVENFYECYHCGPAHKEYCRIHESGLALSVGGARAAEEYRERIDRWQERTAELGHPVGGVAGGRGFDEFARPEDFPGGRLSGVQGFAAYRLPLRDGFMTQSADGRPVAPLLGQLREFDGGEFVASVGSLSHLLGACDHAVLFSFQPIDATTTDVELTWLVRGDAVEGTDYDPARVTWLWDVTTEQDAVITNLNQAGVQSRAYVGGPYSRVEWDTTRFVASYLREIA